MSPKVGQPFYHIEGGQKIKIERDTMSLKFSKTTADYLPWSDMIVLVQKLERDSKLLFALLISVGAYTGLRISDLRLLRWEQLLDQEYLEIIETKTKKFRKIKLNAMLLEVVKRLFRQSGADSASLLFARKGKQKALSVQYINRKLKALKYKYGLKIKNFSTHTLRKTFGRHIWESSNYSEKVITILSDMFNHTSYKVTRRYLGINEQDIDGVYDFL